MLCSFVFPCCSFFSVFFVLCGVTRFVWCHSFFVVSLVFCGVIRFLWCHSFFRAVWWFSAFLVFPCCPSSSCTGTLCKASRDPAALCTAFLLARHDTWDLQLQFACAWRSTRSSALVVFVVSITRMVRMAQYGVFSVVTGLYRCSFFRVVTIRTVTT